MSRPNLVPLALRAPRPPTAFVGRSAELARLGDRLARAHAIAITGDAGVGKTSLVLQALDHAGLRTDAVYLVARPGEAVAAVLCDVLHALAPFDEAAREVARAVHHRDMLLGAALDVAERAGIVVVVEDAHHLEDDAIGAVVDAFARFATRARLCVTSRRPIRAGAHDTIALPAMPLADLVALARAIAPELDDLQRTSALDACGGTPWGLRRCLEAIAAGLPPSIDRLLAGLDPAAIAVAEILATVRIPLPATTLGRLVDGHANAIAALTERGLATSEGSGVRLHETAVALLADRRAHGGPAARIAAALAVTGDADATLEAARILALDDPEAARRLLAAEGSSILAAGAAPRLAKLVATLPPSPTVLALREACAVELGDASVLEGLEAPLAPDPARRLAWARALAARREPRRAAEAALEASHSDDPWLAFWAGYRALRLFFAAGAHDDAWSVVDTLATPSPAAAVRRDLARALLLLRRGKVDVALELGARSYARSRSPDARERLPSVAGEIDHGLDVAWWWACILYEASAYDRARTVLDDALAEANASNALLQHTIDGRAVLYLQACIALMRGDLPATQRIAACLGPSLAPGARWSQEVTSIFLQARLLAGDLATIDDDLAAALTAARTLGNPNVVLPLETLRVDLARLRAEDAPPIPPAEGWTGELLAVSVARARIRREDVATPTITHDDEIRAHADAVDADRALVAGRIDAAVEAWTRVIAAFDRSGNRGALAEALGSFADALLVAGRDGECARALDRLAALAEALPSRRFALDARFTRALLAWRAEPDPASLLAALGADAVSPIAARRVAALAGGGAASPGARVDRIDALVLARSGVRLVRAFGPELGFVDAEAWILHPATRGAWLRDRIVDFRRRPVAWALVTAMLARAHVTRGATEETKATETGATKEALVAAAWPGDVYHPLRHDNRLQVAIRDLRKLVEDEPARPVRIVTTPNGYALASALVIDATSP